MISSVFRIAPVTTPASDETVREFPVGSLLSLLGIHFQRHQIAPHVLRGYRFVFRDEDLRLDALVFHIAGKFFRQVYFIIYDVFHVNARYARILKNHR
ncbi:MAG: hypothetical protein JWM21_956 [Acidobacteria bacterium]|nr:hypothetical protein [Acidobacteriota bacterium]